MIMNGTKTINSKNVYVLMAVLFMLCIGLSLLGCTKTSAAGTRNVDSIIEEIAVALTAQRQKIESIYC